MKPLLLFLVLGLYACGQNEFSSAADHPGRNGTNSERYAGSESKDNTHCKFDDGTHIATVHYYNPNTGYNNTYKLQVHLSDCMVIRIDFPKGGWLDEDHIEPAEIDEDGDATVEDDQGRTWKIHLN